jgi:hypothetical protein
MIYYKNLFRSGLERSTKSGYLLGNAYFPLDDKTETLLYGFMYTKKTKRRSLRMQIGLDDLWLLG